MFLVPLGMMQLLGTELRDGSAFSNPLINRIYLVGSVILPVLALSLAAGGDRFVCRSRRLVNVLFVTMCTPLIHWLLVVKAISEDARVGSHVYGQELAILVLELAIIASVPILLATGCSAVSSEGNTHRTSRLDWVVITGISVLIVVLMLVPVVARRFYHPPTRFACLSNLKVIGLAIAMYSDSYQGRCPMDSADPTLVGSMQLLSNVLPSATVFYCPRDQRPDAYAEPDFKKLTTNNISYSYVPNLKWQDTPDSPLALDRIYTTAASSRWPSNGNHKAQGGNVLFNDGHVSWSLTLPSALKDRDGKLVVLSP